MPEQHPAAIDSHIHTPWLTHARASCAPALPNALLEAPPLPPAQDNSLNSTPPPALQVIDVLVECVCHSASIRDDKIQMHVVRVLQTAVMSEPCHVHGNALLLCIRTCFNVFLGSESAPNQSAAKVLDAPSCCPRAVKWLCLPPSMA